MISLFPSQVPTALPTPACSHCGHNASLSSPSSSVDAFQRQISDLQAQIQLLTQKATAAVDKWADYEDEIKLLRWQNAQRIETVTPEIITPPLEEIPSPLEPAPSSTITNRLSSFLRKPSFTISLPPPQPSPTTPSLPTLLSALTQETALRQREQSLRLAAEGKLSEASGELEDLTVELFERANEMVAEERRERRKLEERVGILEKRECEKRARLERLEGAVGRIERVRGVLGRGNL